MQSLNKRMYVLLTYTMHRVCIPKYNYYVEGKFVTKVGGEEPLKRFYVSPPNSKRAGMVEFDWPS